MSVDPFDYYHEYLRTMARESDRGCLLVGLSQLDSGLGEMLEAYLARTGAKADAKWLLDAKPGNRPLASLAVRTRVARCLGLINEAMRRVIDELRSIRNAHAHGVAEFVITEQDIAPAMAAWWPEQRSVIEMLADDDAESGFFPTLSLPRLKLTACISIAVFALEINLDRVREGSVPIEFGEPPVGDKAQ